MITIYGIKNCDTMKKAMRWLEQHGVAFKFGTSIERFELDGDGVTDCMIGFRQKPPSVVWYRRKADG